MLIQNHDKHLHPNTWNNLTLGFLLFMTSYGVILKRQCMNEWFGVKQAMEIASTQYYNGIFAKLSIVLASMHKERFHCSMTSFCWGVYGAESCVLSPFPSKILQELDFWIRYHSDFVSFKHISSNSVQYVGWSYSFQSLFMIYVWKNKPM